jgi:hypothetical protein
VNADRTENYPLAVCVTARALVANADGSHAQLVLFVRVRSTSGQDLPGDSAYRLNMFATPAVPAAAGGAKGCEPSRRLADGSCVPDAADLVADGSGAATSEGTLLGWQVAEPHMTGAIAAATNLAVCGDNPDIASDCDGSDSTVALLK